MVSAANPEPPRAPADPQFRSRLLLAVVVVVLTIAGALALWIGLTIFLLAFAGLLFAVVLQSLALWIRDRTGMWYGAALSIVVLLGCGLIGGGAWLLTSTVVEQAQELGLSARKSATDLRDQVEQYPWAKNLELPSAEDIISSATGYVSHITSVFAGVLGIVGNIVIVAFIGVYVAIDPGVYRRGLLHLIPKPRRARANQVVDRSWDTLRWWMIGRLVNMTLIGVATFIGLWALDVPLALVLALIAFVLDFIPYIGPILAAIPAILVALADSPSTALYVALLYFGIQSVESYLLGPLIEERAVSLPPVMTLTAQVLGGLVAGTLGVMFATPLVALAIVLVKMLYVEDILGDKGVLEENADHA